MTAPREGGDVDVPELPDVAGSGKLTCFCGNLTVGPTTTPSSHISMRTQCPSCGCVIEPVPVIDR